MPACAREGQRSAGAPPTPVEADPEPGGEVAVRSAAIRGGLRRKGRGKRRQDDQAKRPVQRTHEPAHQRDQQQYSKGCHDCPRASAPDQARHTSPSGCEQGNGRRLRGDDDPPDQGRHRVAEPAQRDSARHGKRPTLDLVDPPLGPEDPLVGADRRRPLAEAARVAVRGGADRRSPLRCSPPDRARRPATQPPPRPGRTGPARCTGG